LFVVKLPLFTDHMADNGITSQHLYMTVLAGNIFIFSARNVTEMWFHQSTNVLFEFYTHRIKTISFVQLSNTSTF